MNALTTLIIALLAIGAVLFFILGRRGLALVCAILFLLAVACMVLMPRFFAVEGGGVFSLDGIVQAIKNLFGGGSKAAEAANIVG